MALRTTRWKPDTCGCVIVYEWDDALDENARTHVFVPVGDPASPPDVYALTDAEVEKLRGDVARRLPRGRQVDELMAATPKELREMLEEISGGPPSRPCPTHAGVHRTSRHVIEDAAAGGLGAVVLREMQTRERVRQVLLDRFTGLHRRDGDSVALDPTVVFGFDGEPPNRRLVVDLRAAPLTGAERTAARAALAAATHLPQQVTVV